MSRPGISFEDVKTTNRSIPINAPHPPAAPLVAPTGSPGVNSVIDVVNATAAPFQNAPPPEQGVAGYVAQGLGGVLGVMGAPQMIIDTAFASLTAPIAKLFPAMPAMTLGGMHIGTPHMHAHPPSLVAPGVMIPLPSIGPIMGSGAVSVLIGGMPAARAGDIGIAVTCGSLAPPFNIHTGSSNVFIGGARAARIGDITDHCNPEGGAEMTAFAIAMSAACIAAGAAGAASTGSPWAAAQAAADAAVLALRLLCGKDPGIPPCVGALIGPPVPNVLIGGFPCPPIGEMAVGALLKGLKKAGSALKKKFGSKRANAHCGSASEPVYVVTGENFNSFVDFVSGGLFEWRRHYTTARQRNNGPLGHGWRHFYQRTLAVRLHRARFTDWDGVTVEFPRFERGSNRTRADGYVLERLARGHYRLSTREEPRMEFVGNEFGSELRLASLASDERELTFGYDDLGRLTTAIERVHRTREVHSYELRYDVRGHMTHLLELHPGNGHPAGEPTIRSTYHVDTAADLSRADDALGGAWRYEYDAFHRWTRQTDPRNYSYRWRYDALGRCIEARGEDGLWTAQLEYLPDQGMTRLTQGDGATWEYHYDADGFITKIVDPYGGKKTREKDGEGRIALETDSGGRELRWLYDENDAHVGRIDRFGNLFPPEREMPVLPNPFEKKLPDTARGRLFDGAPELSPQAVFGADPRFFDGLPPEIQPQARLCFQVRPIRAPSHSVAARVDLDALGRTVREIDPLGRTRQWRYDATGNLVATHDRDGRVSRQKTTSWNLVGERQNALGHALQFEYSRLEELVALTDPLGNKTRYEYDKKERLIRVHRGGKLREHYVYDVGDHFIEKRDGQSALIFANEIHPNHFVKTRRLASGGVHEFDYDASGRITEASTGEHQVQMGHDVLGRRVRDLCDGLGVQHVYGAASIRTTVLGRFVLTSSHADGVTRLVNPSGKETRLTFRDDGVIERQCSNGTIEVMQHDVEGRLVGRLAYRRDHVGRLSRWSAAYGYSAEGDLLRRDDSLRGTTRYEVDDGHRLVAENTPRDERVLFPQDSADNVYLGSLELGPGNKIVRSGAESFAFDERDRMVERRKADGSTVRYHYDSFDMLLRVEHSRVGSETWQASYDAIARRLETRCGDATRRYYWDSDRLAAEVLPGGQLRIYQYATLEALVPLAFVEYSSLDADPASGRTFDVFSEPSGMPLFIEDEKANPVWSPARLHPFGQVELRGAPSIEYNLRWPGHYHDPETGLHYNRYRYYDPILGRYLQSDPIGYAGSPVNLYAYCNNPLVQVDVLGLHPEHVEGSRGARENAGEPDGREGTPGRKSPGPKLPGVTAKERALAASPATTRAARAARKKVVSSFLGEHGQEWNKKTSSYKRPTKKQIREQLRGHDLDKPLTVGPPPPCPAKQTQWQRKGGNQGSYYSDSSAKPTEIGISSYARGKDGRYESKEQKPYDIKPDAPYLESTAAPCNDKWSVSGQQVPAKGGGTQRVVPDRSMATEDN